MIIARTIRAAAFAAAGALVSAGAAHAGPAINLDAGKTTAAATEATPVYYRGSYSHYYRGYYRPYYNPYYRPYYGYRHGYYRGYRHGYYRGYHRRRHGGVYIRTPGLRLGIGF